MLEILFQDEFVCAVYKPAGMLVHRTAISDGTQFVVQELREQLGHWVYPVHRLDRAACGVLILGKNQEAASKMGEIWQKSEVKKKYQLVVRGWLTEPGKIDRPLPREKDGSLQSAVTTFFPISHTEIPLAVGPYQTARYTFVEGFPETGRFHQLRRHLAGIGHPILGDYKHGDYRHNNAIDAHFGIHRLMLLGKSLTFTHPFTHENLEIQATPDPEWTTLIEKLGLITE